MFIIFYPMITIMTKYLNEDEEKEEEMVKVDHYQHYCCSFFLVLNYIFSCFFCKKQTAIMRNNLKQNKHISSQQLMVNGWPVSLIFLLTGIHRVDNLSNTRKKIETLTSGNVYPTKIINLFSVKSHNIVFGQI